MNEKAIVDTVVENIEKLSWTDIEEAENISIRLRKLHSDETKDQGNQTHIFSVKGNSRVIENQLKQFTPKIKPYSRSLYNRLDSQQKEKYASLCDGYIKKHWWFLEEEKTRLYPRSTTLPTADVFMTFSGHDDSVAERKPRLVCDCRDANALFGENISSTLTATSVPIQQLRLFGPKALIAGDLEAAFYHVELADLLVPLRCGSPQSGLAFTNRMIFGLSFGTSALIQALNIVRTELARLHPISIKIFADDYTIYGNSTEVLNDLKLWLAVLERCGFNSNADKYSILIHDSIHSDFVQAIKEDPHWNETKLDAKIKDSLKVLGVNFSYRNDQLICQNGTIGKWKTTQMLIEEFLKRDLTKQEYFAISGQIGYDPIQCDSTGRLIADSIRRLIGGLNLKKDNGWLMPVILENEDPKLVDQLRILMEWCLEHVKATLAAPPTHPTPLHEGAPAKLIVDTDASHRGGGYCIRVQAHGSGSLHLLAAKAWTWSKKFLSNHVNQKEARALYKALEAMAALVDENLDSIIIRCDNSATVGWVNKNKMKVSECLCRRSLQLLIKSCREELNYLKQFAPVTIMHVAGELNGTADTLSRMYEKAMGSFVEIEEVDAETPVDLTRDSMFEQLTSYNDTIAQVKEAYEPIIETLARNSRTLDQLVLRYTSVRNLARRWLEKTRKESLEEIDKQEGVDGMFRLMQSECRAELNTAGDILVEEDGILKMKELDFSGNIKLKIWIPKATIFVRKCLIRDFHLTHGHSGIDWTLAQIRDNYYCPAIRNAVKSLITKCTTCQKASAQRNSAIAPHQHYRPENINMKPYEHSELDILYCGGNWKVLTITCKLTGHLTMTSITEESTQGVLKALDKIQYDTGKISLIFSDKASYFQKLRGSGLTITHRQAYAPWESAEGETLHRYGMQVLRKLIAQYRIKPKGENREKLLKMCSFIMNTRILKLSSEHPITPDMLVYGYTREAMSIHSLRPRGSAAMIRDNFFRMYSTMLRERSLLSMARKERRKATWRPQVGSKALMYTPSTKDLFDWSIVTIVELRGRRAEVRTMKGKTKTVSVTNLAPLAIEEEDVTEQQSHAQ